MNKYILTNAPSRDVRWEGDEVYVDEIILKGKERPWRIDPEHIKNITAKKHDELMDWDRAEAAMMYSTVPGSLPQNLVEQFVVAVGSSVWMIKSGMVGSPRRQVIELPNWRDFLYEEPVQVCRDVSLYVRWAITNNMGVEEFQMPSVYVVGLTTTPDEV